MATKKSEVGQALEDWLDTNNGDEVSELLCQGEVLTSQRLLEIIQTMDETERNIIANTLGCLV